MPELQKIMMEFSKQSEQMEMKQEMIGEALEDVSRSGDTRATRCIDSSLDSSL